MQLLLHKSPSLNLPPAAGPPGMCIRYYYYYYCYYDYCVHVHEDAVDSLFREGGVGKVAIC